MPYFIRIYVLNEDSKRFTYFFHHLTTYKTISFLYR